MWQLLPNPCQPHRLTPSLILLPSSLPQEKVAAASQGLAIPVQTKSDPACAIQPNPQTNTSLPPSYSGSSLCGPKQSWISAPGHSLAASAAGLASVTVRGCCPVLFNSYASSAPHHGPWSGEWGQRMAPIQDPHLPLMPGAEDSALCNDWGGPQEELYPVGAATGV